MMLLWVYVPPTSTVEKWVNRIYDRNKDGDMDILILQFNSKICTTEKAIHMWNIRYSHILQLMICVWT